MRAEPALADVSDPAETQLNNRRKNMGLTKRIWEQRQDKRSVAQWIACKAGCLKECEFHEGTFVNQHSDPTDAFRLGNSMFKGKLDKVFDTRKEITDEIKAAIEESADECYSCVRLFGPS